MRLNTRSKVDLPQPDGPMIAVTCFSGMSMLMLFSAGESPYRKLRLRTDSLGGDDTAAAAIVCAEMGGGFNMAVSSVMDDPVAMQIPARAQAEQQHEQRDQQRAGPGDRVQRRVGVVGVLVDRHGNAGHLVQRIGDHEVVAEGGRSEERRV